MTYVKTCDIALSRITPFMDFLKKRFLLHAFFMSQFSYFPLSLDVSQKNQE